MLNEQPINPATGLPHTPESARSDFRSGIYPYLAAFYPGATQQRMFVDIPAHMRARNEVIADLIMDDGNMDRMTAGMTALHAEENDQPALANMIMRHHKSLEFQREKLPPDLQKAMDSARVLRQDIQKNGPAFEKRMREQGMGFPADPGTGMPIKPAPTIQPQQAPAMQPPPNPMTQPRNPMAQPSATTPQPTPMPQPNPMPQQPPMSDADAIRLELQRARAASRKVAMPAWYHLTNDPDFQLDPEIEPTDLSPRGVGKGIFLTQRPDEWASIDEDGLWSGDRPYVVEVDAPDNLHERPGVRHDPDATRPDDPFPGADEIFVPANQFSNLRVKRVRPREE